jgi:hypothetical protein
MIGRLMDYLRCRFYLLFGPTDSLYWVCPRCGGSGLLEHGMARRGGR